MPRHVALGAIEAGSLHELGLHRPGTDRGHRDTAALDLLVNRLAETQHEGLGRRIGRRPGERLEGGGGGDVDHRASAALDHRREVPRLEVEHRDAVELDHRHLALAVAGASEPGVVDQDLDLQPEPADPGGDLVARGGRPEVGGDRLGPDAVAAGQLLGERPKPLLAPCDQGQAVAPRRELARDRLADPGGRSGDQRRRGPGGHGKRHAGRLPQARGRPRSTGSSRPAGFDH